MEYLGFDKAWPHQKEIIEKGLTGSLYIAAEVGTGKTFSTIQIIRNHVAAKRIRMILIVAPLVMLRTWERELREFAPELEDIYVYSGSDSKKRKIIQKFESDFLIRFTPKILIVNYEALQKIAQYNFCVVVCDEAHKLKGHDSLRTRMCIKLADKARYKYLLSGTPILNIESEIWSQFRILDRGETFGINYYKFRSDYFFDRNAGMTRNHFPNYVLKPGFEKSFRERMHRKMVVYKAADVLTLPDRIFKTVVLDMGSSQRKLYDDMRNSYVAQLTENQATIATTALTKALRLMQICSGYMPVEDLETDVKTFHAFEECPKHAWLKDNALELKDYKPIIWVSWKHNYHTVKRCLEDLNLRVGMLTGEQSQDEREKTIASFKVGKLDYLICNAQSVGVGVTLIDSTCSIYFSQTHSLEYREQSLGRNYRAGQKNTVRVFDLAMNSSIDENILKALKNKSQILFDALNFEKLS